MPFLLALVACTPGSPTAVEAPQITLPPPACLEHSYLPIAGMGDLVSGRHDPGLSFTPEELEALLNLLGDVSMLAPFEHAVDSWQVRYHTQDRGEPAQATALVVVPRDLPGPHPVVLWLHSTAGGNDLCAPSALGAYGASFPIAIAAHLGAVVVAPDYLGLSNGSPASPALHPYMVPEPTAISSLDAVRAAQGLALREGYEIETDAVVAWGISQGGHAALWVDRYQPGYAPEIGIAGVVAAIPPTDMQELFERAATTFSRASEALPAVMVATADWYRIDEDALLAPGVAAQVRAEMTSGCNVLDPAGDLDDVDALFSEALRTNDLPVDWVCALGANRVTTTPLEPSGAPIYMVLGEADELAWSDISRADAATLCESGVEIELVECAGADHEDAAIDTFFVQEAWVADRLAGRARGPSCTLPTPVDCTL